MFNFFPNNNSAFGLDVTGSSFKVVQFKKERSGVKVIGYSDVNLPKGMIVNDELLDPKTFAFLLKQAVSRPQFGTFEGDQVISSIPESKSFVRVIQLPQMGKSELETAVPVEAESFIPLPLDQVYLDWQVLGSRGEKQEILIIAAPKNFVDKYIEILENAGLTVRALEVESQSCHRAVVESGNKSSCIIVDIDAFRTSLITIENGNLQFTSSIPIAGATFTETIAQALGISSQKAEMIKRRFGVNNAPEYPNIKTALLPVLNNLSAEIQNIIKFHGEHSQQKIEKIFLTGGGAKLKGLAEGLVPVFQAENIAVVLGNPWVNLPAVKDPPMDPIDSLDFTTAIGLAMRNLIE